ncbi:MAG: hypothetical protein AVDCRST_MAG64-1271, partial [uncultured Phycisphaerae bacterium]
DEQGQQAFATRGHADESKSFERDLRFGWFS